MFPLPKALDTTTVLPTEIPLQKPTSRFVRVPHTLTAARAESPTKFPSTTESVL